MGKLVVLKAVADINATSQVDLVAEEAFQLIEEYHSSLSATVAEAWNLPD